MRKNYIVKARKVDDGIYVTFGINSTTIPNGAQADLFVMSFIMNADLAKFSRGQEIEVRVTKYDVERWELL